MSSDTDFLEEIQDLTIVWLAAQAEVNREMRSRMEDAFSKHMASKWREVSKSVITPPKKQTRH